MYGRPASASHASCCLPSAAGEPDKSPHRAAAQLQVALSSVVGFIHGGGAKAQVCLGGGVPGGASLSSWRKAINTWLGINSPPLGPYARAL